MSGLRISLFGPPRFELHASLKAVQERKATALLVYLVVSAERHSRDALATMLWPKQSQSAARASLRHALWSLRKAGLGEIIEVEREKLGIHPPYWLDVIEFNQLINKHRQHGFWKMVSKSIISTVPSLPERLPRPHCSQRSKTARSA